MSLYKILSAAGRRSIPNRSSVPSYLSSRAFSSYQNNDHPPIIRPNKVIMGAVVVGSALLALHDNGMLEKYFTKEYIYKQIPKNNTQVKERNLPDVPESSMPSDDTIIKPAEESLDLMKSPEVNFDEEQDKAIKAAAPKTKTTGPTGSMPDQVAINTVSYEEITTNDVQEGVISKTEDPSDGYISKDGVLVLDFLQAIHAAEERQAEVDARSFAEERRAIKEKYEKEIKDARVRELMYAEREAVLYKELTKQRVKTAAALKLLQEKIEERLKIELEQKEIEVEQTLKKVQDIVKAEFAAAIASEKASQIEKMAEANLHGILALEDALTKGLPVEKEMQALHTHLEGADKESLITLVISSLPEDTRKCGTDTLPQLKHKEADQSGDGIESLINKVENLLAQGKLSEAADALANGVKGSQAAEVVDDWVKRARNRAITEQALTVLQSYATSIRVT